MDSVWVETGVTLLGIWLVGVLMGMYLGYGLGCRRGYEECMQDKRRNFSR